MDLDQVETHAESLMSAIDERNQKLSEMTESTELCDFYKLIFAPTEAAKYTNICTNEEYDTIQDLGFTYTNPGVPSADHIQRELCDLNIEGPDAQLIVDGIMRVLKGYAQKSAAGPSAEMVLLAKSFEASRGGRALGKVRYDFNGRVTDGIILGDASIQAPSGRIFTLVSEWLETQEQEPCELAPLAPSEYGPMDVPMMPPPAPPIMPHR